MTSVFGGGDLVRLNEKPNNDTYHGRRKEAEEYHPNRFQIRIKAVMMDDGVLVETKLHPPRAREEWVKRTELLQRLARSTAKLILVEAPAGFGKSTLVAQWSRLSRPEQEFRLGVRRRR